jgi:hypothetical protein
LRIRIGSEMWSLYLLTIELQLPQRRGTLPRRRAGAGDVGAALRAVDRLDFEVAAAFAGPAHALVRRQPGAARLDGDAVGDDEARIEADAELADQVGVLLLVAFELRP